MFQIFSVYLKNETTPQLMWLHVVDYKKQGSAEEKRKKKDRQTLFTIKNWLYPLSITHPDENIICFTLTYNSGFYYDYVTQCSGHIMAWCLGLKPPAKSEQKLKKKL